MEIQRMSVGLAPPAVKSLENLKSLKGISKTEIINRALQFYEFFELEKASGRNILIENPETGKTEKIHIL